MTPREKQALDFIKAENIDATGEGTVTVDAKAFGDLDVALAEPSPSKDDKCPYPVDGYQTVGACMKAGWCGCDNGPKIDPGYKPWAAASPNSKGQNDA